MNRPHIPVLCDFVTELLTPETQSLIIDGTFGFGGHYSELISKMPADSTYVGIDRDSAAIDFGTAHYGQESRLRLVHNTYENMTQICTELNLPLATGILLDLGISSFQLDASGKGFRFQGENEPLDMRMGEGCSFTAADIVNTWDKSAILDVLERYGDIRNGAKFVDIVCETRFKSPYLNTADLIHSIKKGFYFANSRRRYVQTCQTVFQALRIAVNDELGQLERFLEQSKSLLAVQGRLAIITFHSVEDKMVKRFTRENKDWITPINKKVIQLNYHEAKKNTRARSAKLRVLVREH